MDQDKDEDTNTAGGADETQPETANQVPVLEWEESTTSANFDPENLSSRYSAELDQQQQQGATEESASGDSDDLEPEPLIQDASATEVKPLFDAHDSFHNVDQTVNLMDARADNYSALPDEQDPHKQASNKKPPKEETTVPMMEALMGNAPHITTHKSWSTAPRPERIRRETWDTSFVGRLAVWLIFFFTMFVFTFWIPYMLMDDTITSDEAHKAAQPQTPDLDLSDDNFLFKDASRIDNIKTVIVQSGLTSEKALQDKTSKQYIAARWLSETDPAQVEPLVNHHENIELLQRYALAVFYYSTADAALPGIVHEAIGMGIEHLQPHADVSEDAPAEPSQDASDSFTVPFQAHSSPNSTSTADESPSEAQSAHLEQHPDLDNLDLTQSAHFEGHGEDTDAEPLPMLSMLERSGEEAGSSLESRVVRVERNNEPHTRRLAADASLAWARDKTWMSDSNICDWYGVTCEDDETLAEEKRPVVGLDLDSIFLKGTIPSEILAFSKLTMLDLSHNFLTGTIPGKLWRTLPLESFSAFGNMLSGSIHADIERMTNLGLLDLSHNMMMTGSIPEKITNLRHLRSLILEGNQLSGTIPPMVELTSLSSLDQYQSIFSAEENLDLGLADNMLVGTFPPEIDSLQSLHTLDLSNNRMGGALPEVFPRLVALKSLNLGGNNFNLNLPTSLGHLNELESLVLSSNNFRGPIPEEWSGMTSLLSLSLDQNRISGTIPTRLLRKMSSLQVLVLSQNEMTGALPAELEYLSGLKTLDLSANSFFGAIPTQLGALDALEILNLRIVSSQVLCL